MKPLRTRPVEDQTQGPLIPPVAEDEDHGLVESAAPDLFRGEQQGALRKRLAVFLFFGRGEGAKAVCRGFVNDGGVSRFFVAHSCLSLVPKM